MTLFTLLAKLGLDSTEYESGMDKAKSTADSTGSAISAKTIAMGNMISSALKAAAGKLVQFGKNVMETGKSFDSAMSQLAATMGTTTDQIDDLKAKAQQMGATTAFTAEQAAQGLNILAMAGLDATQQIAGIETVLNLASAGAMSLDQSASYLVGTVNGFSDSMENAQYYADLMAKGATLANTSVDQLGAAMSSSAATAAAYGQSADGVTLALLRLANQNVTGTAAATAMNRAMSDLYTPTQAGKAALEQLGIATYDSNGKARDFNTVVDQLNSRLSGMTEQEANAYKATIFTTQGLKAFNMMTVSTAEQVEYFTTGLQHASDGLGSAAQQAHTQLDNLQGDLTLFSSAADGFMLSMYNSVSESLRSIVQLGTNFLTELTTLYSEKGFSGIIEGVTKFTSNMVQKFTDMIPKILEGCTKILGGISELMTNIATTVLNALPNILNVGKQIIDKLAQGIKAKTQLAIQSGAETVQNVINGIVNTFPAVVESAVNLIVNFVDGVLDSLPKLLDASPQIVHTIIQGIINTLPKLLDAAVKIIISLVEYLIQNLPKILQAGIKIVGELISGLLQSASKLSQAAFELVKQIWDAFTHTDWLQVGKSIIDGIWNGIKNFASNVVNAATQVAQDIFNSVKNFFGIKSPSRLMRDQIGKNIALGLAEGIGDQINAVQNAVSGLEAAASPSVSTGLELGGSVSTYMSDFSDWTLNRMASAFAAAMNAAGVGTGTVELDGRELGRWVRDGMEVGFV